MTSNIQLTSEIASEIPPGSAPGKARLFRDVADGTLKLKDDLGVVFNIATVQDFKESVRVAATATLPAYTRLLNVITANAFGALPAQDGVTLSVNDSLVYAGGAGPAAADNGIYVVAQVGTGGTPFILTRRGDFATSSQVNPGMVVPTGPEGTANKSQLFILATADPITLNTTPLSFVTIGGGGSESTYSLTAISDTQTIPQDQSMVYMDNVVVGDGGDLSLDGDVVTARTEDNFSVDLVPLRSVRVVQENDLLLYTSSLQVDGDLVVDGDLLDVTPPDGNDILAALTLIAPATPSILGVASPASFLTPGQARSVMDVYSTSETDTAIADAVAGSTVTLFDTFWNGSSNPNGTFNGSDVNHTTSFTAEFGRINKWSAASAGIIATLPVCTTADHNKRTAFLEIAGTNANYLQINASGSSQINIPENAGLGVASIVARGVNSLVEFQYNASIDTWTVVKESYGLKGFINGGTGMTAVGRNALINADVTLANANTAVGDSALGALTTGTSNTAVGYLALQGVTTGTSNVAIGPNALAGTTTGNNCIAIGPNALLVGSAVANDIAIGSSSLDSCTTGTGNTGVGRNTLQAISTSNDNTALGDQAMGSGIAGSSNVAVGAQALLTTTASNNVAVGFGAHRQLSSGTRNAAVGFEALRNATTSSDNTALGYQAARSMTTGQLNTAIGGSALFTQTTATTCTAVGFEALFTNNASSITGVGYRALRANTSGLQNVAVGYQALQANTTAAGNTAVGHSCLQSSTTGASNTGIGASSLQANSTGANNTAMGFETLFTVSTTGNNTALGYQALRLNTATGITAVGYQCLDANSSGTNNTALGTSALGANTTATGNTAVGFQALLLSDANNNTAVGDSTLDANTSGADNTGVGQNALGGNSTASSNTAIGSNAMAVSTTAANSTAVGKSAGSALSTGGNNTFVGYQAGDTCSTGTGNVVIGFDADVPTSGTSNYLNIANAIIGNTSTGDAGAARFLLRSVTAGITASTTQTQGQGPLTKDVNQVSVVANTNDTVTLPSAAAGMEIIVINSGVNTLQVFPASGDNLGAGVDTATTQTTGTTSRYVAYDATNWVKL